MSRVIINYCMVCDKHKLMSDKDTSICGECHAKLVMMGCNALLTDNMEASKIFIGLNNQGDKHE